MNSIEADIDADKRWLASLPPLSPADKLTLAVRVLQSGLRDELKEMFVVLIAYARGSLDEPIVGVGDEEAGTFQLMCINADRLSAMSQS